MVAIAYLASKFILLRLNLIFNLLFAPAAYFVLVATIAAFTGQHVVRKIIALLGRASIIIFILAMTIFVSAISLGIWLSSFPLFHYISRYYSFLFFFIFTLRCWIFLLYVTGGVGIANMVEKLANQEYMGFENLCHES